MNDLKDDLRDSLANALADLRTLRDGIKVKLHLGGMEAKDQWKRLEPELGTIEKELEKGGEAVAGAVKTTVEELRQSLRQLRDELQAK